MLKSQVSFRTFSPHNFKPLMRFESLCLQLACDLHWNRQRTRVQCFKDHLLYIKASLMKESVLFSVCITTRAAYSGAGVWINEIGCLHHEVRLPEDWKKTSHQCYFLVIWPHLNFGNQKPQYPPFICWKHTSWFESRLGVGQMFLLCLHLNNL